MKIIPVPGTHRPRLFAPLLAMAALFALAATDVRAQSCPAPVDWSPSVVHSSFSGTTCGQQHVADTFCEGAFDNPGPNYVLRFFRYPTTTEITLSGQVAGFDPVVYLSNSPDQCAGGRCITWGDTGFPMQVGDLPVGIYYLVVAANGLDGAGACGNFTLDMNGDFTGGEDFIFANGFD
jgi:hypothetical protein